MTNDVEVGTLPKEPNWVIGQGFRQRMDEQNLKAMGPETYFAPGYSFVLTDKGPLWYSQYKNEVVGPFA